MNKLLMTLLAAFLAAGVSAQTATTGTATTGTATTGGVTTGPAAGTVGGTTSGTTGTMVNPAGTVGPLSGTTAGSINLGASPATSLGTGSTSAGTNAMGNNRKECPPGLEKRNNDCVAPGLLKKTLP